MARKRRPREVDHALEWDEFFRQRGWELSGMNAIRISLSGRGRSVDLGYLLFPASILFTQKVNDEFIEVYEQDGSVSVFSLGDITLKDII